MINEINVWKQQFQEFTTDQRHVYHMLSRMISQYFGDHNAKLFCSHCLALWHVQPGNWPGHLFQGLTKTPPAEILGVGCGMEAHSSPRLLGNMYVPKVWDRTIGKVRISYGCWDTAVVIIISGWWLTYPCEKYESQLGWWHSQYMGKNVPNHQPDLHICPCDIYNFLSLLKLPCNHQAHQRCASPPGALPAVHVFWSPLAVWLLQQTRFAFWQDLALRCGVQPRPKGKETRQSLRQTVWKIFFWMNVGWRFRVMVASELCEFCPICPRPWTGALGLA